MNSILLGMFHGWVVMIFMLLTSLITKNPFIVGLVSASVAYTLAFVNVGGKPR